MKNALALAAACLLALLASCSKPAAELPGSYQIDTAAVAPELKKGIATLPPEQKEAAELMFTRLLTALGEARFDVMADHTFEMKMSFMGQETHEKGTWKQEGEKITFTTTETNGQPNDEVQEGTFKDGVLTVTEPEGMGNGPMTLVMRKRE